MDHEVFPFSPAENMGSQFLAQMRTISAIGECSTRRYYSTKPYEKYGNFFSLSLVTVSRLFFIYQAPATLPAIM